MARKKAAAREVYEEIARRLGDEAVVAEVLLAIDDPDAYVERFEERCDDRDIEDSSEVEPWYALIDALCERNRAAEIDWKTDADTVQWVVDKIFPSGPLGPDRWAWFLDDRYDKIKTDGLLEIAGAFVAAHEHALLELDTDGDSYVLVVRPEADVADLQALAVLAGQGTTRWTGTLPADALAPPPSGPRVEVIVDSPPDADRQRAHYRVFVVDDPLMPYEAAVRREVPLAEPQGLDPIDSAAFVGGRLVAFPWSASTSADLLLIERDGLLVAAPDVPRAERTSIGWGTTGTGTPYILWAGRAWEVTATGFAPFGCAFRSPKDTATVPAAGDAFYAVPNDVVCIGRDSKRLHHPLGDRRFTDAQPGPLGSILLTQNPYDDKPALAWVWFPQHDMVIRIERKLLKIRDTHWIAYSEPIERIVFCIGDNLYALPSEVLRTLPQISASTGRKLRKPIAI